MLEVDNLSVRFRRHAAPPLTILSDLSLTVPSGSVQGLVGVSGAGKSLIASAISGTLPRNAEVSGRIVVDGEAPAPGVVAVQPQGIDALDPLARIGVQIARFARLAGHPVDAPALLHRLGLPPEVIRAWPHELSGGMAKRVCLATALASGAGWLIADEPTAGLDGEAADQITALLGALGGAGYGILVISHDLPRLVSVATTVTVLQDGRCVETADACAFRGCGSRLAHPISRALWRAQGARVPC